MSRNKICGIYKIENIVNNKCYIGQSVDIMCRFKNHRSLAKKEANYPLYRSMRKYGIDNFVFEILEECRREDLNKTELYYINKYNSMLPNGYNIAHGSSTPIKLKEEYVKDIVNLLKNTDMNSEEIGCLYKISGRVVREINSGGAWYDDDINYPIRKKLWTIIAEKRKITKKCKICGIEFETSDKNRKFCSQKCCHKSQEKVDSIQSIDDCIELARAYKSMAEIARCFGVSDHCIKRCFDKIGFDFLEYKEQSNTKLYKIKLDHSIFQIDIITGEVLNTFESPSDAANSLGLKNKSHISEVCNGKLRQAYGYIWKYKNK